MKGRTRLLLGLACAFLALVIVGVVLQAVRTLLWDLSYFLPPWLLTPILLLGLVLIATAVVQVGLPWWRQRQTTAQRRPTQPLQAPTNRRDAADQSLSNIDRLIERLESDIARESLQAERDRVNEELQRGDLVVVVFGTGSSGKTSLIRALLQKMVGDVGAPMGLTKETRSYRLRLKGLSRGLQLVDTPGILEAGDDGLSREDQARRAWVVGAADPVVGSIEGRHCTPKHQRSTTAQCSEIATLAGVVSLHPLPVNRVC